MTDWPGPNDEDRAAWEAYVAAGNKLPPYDEAGEALQRNWWATRRLTINDILDVAMEIVGRRR